MTDSTAPNTPYRKPFGVIDQVQPKSLQTPHFYDLLPRSSSSGSSLRFEDFFVGATLPIVGAISPQVPGGGREPGNVDRDEPKGMHRNGIQFSTTIERDKPPEPQPLPPCEPMPLEFLNVCVDVKVQLINPNIKSNCLNYILRRTGLSGGGPTIEKRVLHNLSGEIKPRKLVALMGASGMKVFSNCVSFVF